MVDRGPNGPDNAIGFPKICGPRGILMDDAELAEEGHVPMSVGERLREAREAAGLTLEDIATSTRIPTRHLESIEAGDFSRLPAPTYTVGFAKNFAGAVGLDRTEIGEQLRAPAFDGVGCNAGKVDHVIGHEPVSTTDQLKPEFALADA